MRRKREYSDYLRDIVDHSMKARPGDVPARMWMTGE